jgi:hypothetical protein
LTTEKKVTDKDATRAVGKALYRRSQPIRMTEGQRRAVKQPDRPKTKAP